MKILITGGCGFIGSHLTEHLLAAGHSVVALDDLSTGSLENIAAFKGHPHYRYLIGSVTDDAVVSGLMAGVDLVYHLAAAVGVRRIVNQPVDTIHINVIGTETVLRHAYLAGCRVMVASTSEVYGKSTAVPFHEDHDLVSGPTTVQRWAYACSKALDEFLALAYYKERGMPVFVVRFFNTVGPRQTGQYGMVVPNFVRQALAGETLLVHGDGNQTRCFTHVKDVVRLISKLGVTDAALGRVFNIGGTEEISIRGLAEKIIAATGSRSTIRLVPYSEVFDSGFEDMFRRVPDVSRLAGLLGDRPETSLDDILRDVITHEQSKAAAGTTARG